MLTFPHVAIIVYNCTQAATVVVVVVLEVVVEVVGVVCMSFV